MKKKLDLTGKILVINMIILLFFASCNPTKQPKDNIVTDGIEVSHKLGKTKIPAQPERIISLDIGAVETMNELGVNPIGIPKKFLPDYLNSLKNNSEIGDVGSVIEPDFEAISALKPDLILISTRQEKFYSELSELAPTIFIGTENKDFLGSFQKNSQLIGQILGKEQEVNLRLDSLNRKIEEAQKHYADDPHKGMFLIYNNGKFSAFGKGSRFGFVHDVLGIKPVMDLQDQSVHGQRVSNELIAEANPDYLFIVDRNAAVAGKKASKEEVENKLIKQTNAFKQGKIVYLDPNVWFISGGGLRSVNMMVDDIVKLIP